MRKYILPILFMSLIFWSCEEEAEEDIIDTASPEMWDLMVSPYTYVENEGEEGIIVVDGIVNISVFARDRASDGDVSGINRVEFLIGDSVICTDSEGIYAGTNFECEWDTDGYEFNYGLLQTINVLAYDNSGNIGEWALQEEPFQVLIDDSVELWGQSYSGLLTKYLGYEAFGEYCDSSSNQFTIPSEIEKFIHLKGLELRDCDKLVGEIPSEIGNLLDLEILFLINNQLSGEIPSEIGNLLNLGRLDLSSNQLSGEIPKEIGNLTNLGWDLILSYNQLSGEIPIELFDIPITSLDLRGNQLTGRLSEEFIEPIIDQGLIEYLNLQENQLYGTIDPSICSLNMTVLQLDHNRLCPPYPVCLAEWQVSGQNTTDCD